MASELEVRESLARGDLDAAAVAALELWGNPVLRYLGSLLRDEETAREVFSQFAEDLWRGLPEFRGECSLRAWCYRLAWHAAARHLRDPWRRRGQPLTSGKISALVQSISTSGRAPGSRRSLLAELRERLSDTSGCGRSWRRWRGTQACSTSSNPRPSHPSWGANRLPRPVPRRSRLS